MKQDNMIILWVPLASTVFKFVFDIFISDPGKVSVALRHFSFQEKFNYTPAQLGLKKIPDSRFSFPYLEDSIINFSNDLTSFDEAHHSVIKYIQAFKILYLTNTSIKL